MSENVRDLLAALWLDRDDIPYGQPFNEEWALRVVRDGRDAEHFGDCTNVATACVRCAVNEALAGADAVLAALDAAGLTIVPKTPTEEMVFAAHDVVPLCALAAATEHGQQTGDWAQANAITRRRTCWDLAAEQYRAMIAAAGAKP